ncbi:hypothetical protein ACLQ2G_34085, partial [Streptomyces flavovirens]
MPLPLSSVAPALRATVGRRTALAASVVSRALLATACGGSDEDAKGDAKTPSAGARVSCSTRSPIAVESRG